MNQWSISTPVWTDPSIWQQSPPLIQTDPGWPGSWVQSGPIFGTGSGTWQQSPPVIVSDPSSPMIGGINLSNMLPWIIGGAILYYLARRK